MPEATARNVTTGATVADRLRVAATHWTRLKGLLGTRGLEPGEGLWLRPCDQVHMLGMRYPLDVVFLDDQLRVVHSVAALQPRAISPRIANATSVLELPVGTLARAGLVPGAQVEIDTARGPAPVDYLAIFGAIGCNLAVAALYALFAVAHLQFGRRTGQWATVVPIVAQEAMLVVLFVTRRASIATTSRPLDWVIGVLGTLLPFLMRATGESRALGWPGGGIQTAGLSLAIAGLASLGRSVGVVAANRGVQTRGVYRWVRHPVYAAYALSLVGYALAHPSARNLIIVVTTLLSFAARASAEERLLARDPAYRAYLAETRWRFVPGLV
jgi:protein-S-isoprenylcysteine O-methyltransferase Ste14/uncharacterized membrane protein (UPF0127 family)